MSIQDDLHNWIPIRLYNDNKELTCRWVYTGTLQCCDPFFDETIQKYKLLIENSKSQRVFTTIDMLDEWGSQIDAVYPTAFIFHISRCGSTLVSQALGKLNRSVSVSEVPIFDEILKLPLKGHLKDVEEVNKLLAGAIRLYGARRIGDEKYFFIKTDSWHLLYYQQLRLLYPEVPFVIIYREPGVVLDSNRRKKGIQGIYCLDMSELCGLEGLPEEKLHPDMFFGYVLEQYYKCILDIAETDSQCLLLNYNEGIDEIIERIKLFAGLEISVDESLIIAERSMYHSKHPQAQFIEQNTGDISHPLLGNLKMLYQTIDNLRTLQFNGSQME